MSLVIHHYFPLNSKNTGDMLVAHAIHQTLRRALGDEIQIRSFAVNDRTPDELTFGVRGPNLQRSNEEANLVVIGGSNLLEPRSRGRWGVTTDMASIASIQRPLVLIGMGTGSDFGKRVLRYREPARSEVIALHRKAALSAVRDEKTAECLRKLGIATLCAGCPVTFLTERAVTPETNADSPLIVSMPPSRLLRNRAGRRFLALARTYMTQLRDRGDVPVLATLHDARDQSHVKYIIPDGVPWFFTDHLDQLMARFEACRGVIGFRLHAALLGLALGKPVLPVAVDWRGRGFIETAALESVSADPSRTRFVRELDVVTQRLLDNDAELLASLNSAKHRLAVRYDKLVLQGLHRMKSTLLD